VESRKQVEVELHLQVASFDPLFEPMVQRQGVAGAVVEGGHLLPLGDLPV